MDVSFQMWVPLSFSLGKCSCIFFCFEVFLFIHLCQFLNFVIFSFISYTVFFSILNYFLRPKGFPYMVLLPFISFKLSSESS